MNELSTDQLDAIAAEAVDPNANGITLTSPEAVEPRTPQDAAGLVDCFYREHGQYWYASHGSISFIGATERDARGALDRELNRRLADLLNAIGENKAAISRLETK